MKCLLGFLLVITFNGGVRQSTLSVYNSVVHNNSIFERVMTVSEAMASLSGGIGRPIVVSKPLQTERVFVGPTSDTPRKLIEEIAFAVHATVRDGPNGLQVVRTPADLSEIRKARAKSSADWIRQGIARMAKFRESARKGVSVEGAYFTALRRQKAQVDEFYKGKRTSVDQLFPEYVLPSGDLLEAVIRRIGIEKLAEIRTGEARVYQDNPVGDDLAMPNCQDLVEKFCREMTPVGATGVHDEDNKLLSEFHGKDVVTQWASSQSLARLRLKIFSYDNCMTFWLDGFDGGGHKILAASCGVGPRYEYSDPSSSWSIFSPTQLSAQVKLDGEASLALKFMSGNCRQPLPDWFRHPDRIDPLNLYVRDVLSALAGAEPDHTLVIAVEDALWSTWRQLLTLGPATLKSLVDGLQAWNQYECANYRDAIVIRAIDPLSQEESKADRKVMARFANALASSGSPSIPDCAAFLSDASRKLSNLAGDWLLFGEIAMGVDPVVSGKNYGLRMLKALGPVSSDQWQKLLSGQVLTVGHLGIGDGLKEILDQEPSDGLYTQPNFPDWRRFCWELMPQGVPNGALVSLSDSSTKLIKWWDNQSEPNFGIAETNLGEGFPWNHFRTDLESQPPTIAGDRAEFEKAYAHRKFRYCERPVFQLRIGLPEEVEMRETIQVGMVNDTETFLFSDLKQELKDQIWKTVCERSLAASLAGRSTANSPPSVAPAKVLPPIRP